MAYDVMLLLLSFFFFKHKTAYEMRISDWSSDVCSSDLPWHAAMRGLKTKRTNSGHSKRSGSGAAMRHARCLRWQTDIWNAINKMKHAKYCAMCCGQIQIGRASCRERVF